MTRIDSPLFRQDASLMGAKESDKRPGIRVLAVDDERAASKLITLMLPSPSYHCTTANNGEEALVALQRERFDAVISDLQMPGVSGLELLAQVRQSYPHMAFLVTTGVDDRSE